MNKQTSLWSALAMERAMLVFPTPVQEGKSPFKAPGTKGLTCKTRPWKDCFEHRLHVYLIWNTFTL